MEKTYPAYASRQHLILLPSSRMAGDFFTDFRFAAIDLAVYFDRSVIKEGYVANLS